MVEGWVFVGFLALLLAMGVAMLYLGYAWGSIRTAALLQERWRDEGESGEWTAVW